MQTRNIITVVKPLSNIIYTTSTLQDMVALAYDAVQMIAKALSKDLCTPMNGSAIGSKDRDLFFASLKKVNTSHNISVRKQNHSMVFLCSYDNALQYLKQNRKVERFLKFKLSKQEGKCTRTCTHKYDDNDGDGGDLSNSFCSKLLYPRTRRQ